jgi:hypothetical protein
MNTETLLGAVSDLALAFLSDCRGLVVLNGISFLNPGFYPLLNFVLNPCDCPTVKCIRGFKRTTQLNASGE